MQRRCGETVSAGGPAVPYFYWIVTVTSKSGQDKYLVRTTHEDRKDAIYKARRNDLAETGDKVTAVPATVQGIADLVDWYGASHCHLVNGL